MPAASSMRAALVDRKSTRLNSSHLVTSYAVFCFKKNTSTSATVTNGTAPGSGTAVLANYSVTGYEPYFQAPPPLSFLGTPGEFFFSQIGDPPCFTPSPSTSFY